MICFDKISKFLNNKHIKIGLPILILLVVGSFELKEFSSVRYEFRNQRFVDEEEFRFIFGKADTFSLEEEYEKIKNKNLDNWTNKRIPREWENVQNYDWGVKGLKSLVGKIARSNMNIEIDENKSYAEFWMGTHPNGPSILKENELSLSEHIQKNPQELGEKIINSFGIQLPFLFKVLSVDKALSIQVHPTKTQAEHLNKKMPHIYKDSNHKPEMAVALTQFETLCSFRPLKEIKFYLKNISEFANLIERDKLDAFLTCDQVDSKEAKRYQVMKECFQSLMQCPQDDIKSATHSLISKLEKYEENEANQYHYDLVVKLNKEFPGDVGIFCIYWLNYMVLEPGEALYLAPNEPHAYLSGDCIECMSNSDNVIRAGLTTKFRDVGTLCDMLSYNDYKPSEILLNPLMEKEGTMLFSPPIRDFSLARITIPANKEYALSERATCSILIIICDPLIYKFGDDSKYQTSKRGFWFPYKTKYVAWSLVLTIIFVSSAFLILYGLTFGLIKCYLWVTAVALSILIGLTIIQPTKIFATSYLLSLVIKSSPFLQFKKIPKSILENTYDEKKAFKAYKIRLDYTPHYIPLPKFRLENRAENIKFHLEQRKLFAEVVLFFIFVLVLTHIIIAHGSWASYYSTQVVKHLTVYASYTDTISFTQVTSYREFLEYLNSSLLPSLFGSIEKYEQKQSVRSYRTPDRTGSSRNALMPRNRKRNSESYLTEFHYSEERDSVLNDKTYFDVRKKYKRFERDESEKNVTEIYERSWTLDRSVKIIGKPRMRQLRVKNNTCAGIAKIKPRERMCFADLTRANEETGDFSLWWSSIADEVLTPKEQKPWNYSSARETGAIHLIAKYSSYPAGGYVLELAKNLEDSRLIVEFMDAFQWIDARTRAVIVEFTLYSVNVNLFNVVHLIAERSASGYFITSYQIDTAKFMFLASELEAISVVMMVAFHALLLLFLYRQAIRIERTSFKSYLNRGNPTIDILIIVLGLISVIFLFLRSIYVSILLDKLDRSQNYEYVSFAYAAVWDKISTYINAILVILAAIKLFQLLRFRVLFLQLQETLRGSSRYFLALTFQFIVVIIGFAFLFHLVLAPFNYQFGTFGSTLSTLVGLAMSLDENYDYSVFANTPWFIAPLFYVFFVILTTLLILSFFVSVICFYFGRIKNTSIENKYNAVAYLKYVLTANDKTDIMRLKGGCSLRNETSDGTLLRLRGGGGGGALAGNRTGKPRKYPFPSDYVTYDQLIKRSIPSFVTEKVYDFNNYFEFQCSPRFEAMKRITRAELETDADAKIRDREIAMSAFVADKLMPARVIDKEKFYTVVNDLDRILVSSGTLMKMKKIVDDYGRDKLIEKYKNVGVDLKIIEDEVVDYTETITALDGKFTELGIVVNEKYKAEKRRKSKERRKSKISETLAATPAIETAEKTPEESKASEKEKEKTSRGNRKDPNENTNREKFKNQPEKMEGKRKRKRNLT